MRSLTLRVFLALLAASLLWPYGVLAISNRESICRSRNTCDPTVGSSVCPTGFTCRADLRSAVSTACSAMMPSSNYLCLSDTDTACLASGSCLDAQQTAGGSAGSSPAAGTCCSCQRTVSGSVVARGFFTIPPPQNCTNFADSPAVRGAYQSSALEGIACQAPASCQEPKTAAELVEALTPEVPSTEPEVAQVPGEEAPNNSHTIPTTIPTLSVPIPGLIYGTPATQNIDSIRYLSVPFLAQYIAALYRYVLGIISLAAVIMVVYGGFLWLVGSAAGDITTAKHVIMDAIAGLLIAMASYLLLSVINSNTLNLQPLLIPEIDEFELEQLTLDSQPLFDDASSPPPVVTGTSDAGGGTGGTGGESTPPPSQQLDRSGRRYFSEQWRETNAGCEMNLVRIAGVMPAALTQAKLLSGAGLRIENSPEMVGLLAVLLNSVPSGDRLKISDAFRTQNAQSNRFVQIRSACGAGSERNNNPGPAAGVPPPSNACRRYGHASGRAMDIFYVPASRCPDPANPATCRTDTCLGPAGTTFPEFMQAHGFVRLCSESWHYEPKRDHPSGLRTSSGGGQCFGGGADLLAGCAGRERH